MTLGDFIDKLDKIDDKKKHVLIEWNAERSIPTVFRSYRGYYSELALGYSGTEEKTVEELLKEAKACIGKEFVGYKGGKYTMYEDTDLFCSDYGECSEMCIDDVVEKEEGVFIIVEPELC